MTGTILTIILAGSPDRARALHDVDAQTLYRYRTQDTEYTIQIFQFRALLYSYLLRLYVRVESHNSVLHPYSLSTLEGRLGEDDSKRRR